MIQLTRCYCLVLPGLLLATQALAQSIPYGSNDSAGRRLQVGDVSLYYEVYGEGSPVLLLHGGLYGYIDEFGSYIAELSKNHTVIVPAMRGHGRSELGSKPFSIALQAEEAAAVLRKVTEKPAVVVGFSHGGEVAYALAAIYPESVRKLVAIGAGPRPSSQSIAWAKGMTADGFARENAGFVRSRKQLMPEPDRWNEFFTKLMTFYAAGEALPEEQIRAIRCPVLIIGGDRDFYFPVEVFTHARDRIMNARLQMIKDCDHLGSLQKPIVLREYVLPFVAE